MDGVLLGRIALRFGDDGDRLDVEDGFSAVAFDADGHLWVASDETVGLEGLQPDGIGAYGHGRHVDLGGLLDLPADDATEEIDIEGLSVTGATLWFTGSHTSNRRKAKPTHDDDEAIDRLAEVERKPNRYLIGRVDIAGDGLANPAQLPCKKRGGNALTKALKADRHLGPFLHRTKKGKRAIQLASKENGFDVEGLAARGNRLFLGLRGPVLRGWAAMLIEIEVEGGDQDDELKLAPLGRDEHVYRKHFVNLEGMGVRDLCWHGDDLIILAGPTMDISGLQTVWRLRDAVELESDRVFHRGDPRLERLFDLPVVHGGDKAEGIDRFDDLGEPGVMIVFDGPTAGRVRGPGTLLADVYRLL